MDEMAVHGNGTFDHDKKQWKLRTKELKLSATTRQLRDMFKEDIPDSEKASRPYWLKYLKLKRAEKAAELVGPTPIPTRIASLEGFISEFKEQGRDTAQLEEELADARTVPDWDIDHVDGPAVHPDMREAAALPLRRLHRVSADESGGPVSSPSCWTSDQFRDVVCLSKIQDGEWSGRERQRGNSDGTDCRAGKGRTGTDGDRTPGTEGLREDFDT
jgi:hypothetical protein